jgi:hypothetical protein
MKGKMEKVYGISAHAGILKAAGADKRLLWWGVLGAGEAMHLSIMPKQCTPTWITKLL